MVLKGNQMTDYPFFFGGGIPKMEARLGEFPANGPQNGFPVLVQGSRTRVVSFVSRVPL